MIPAPPLSTFSLGPFTIHIYGISIALALLICYILASKNAKEKKIPEKEFDQYFFITIVFAIVGARIYHVLANWGYYTEHAPEIIKIWNGGIGIYGGIIVGTFTLFVISVVKQREFLSITDLFAVVLPMGQAIGRWGNYFNQELFGYPTSLPWALYVTSSERPEDLKQFQTYHPTFLYESLLNLLNFTLLYILFTKKSLKSGIVTALYCINYGIIRFIVDIFKIDPDPLAKIGIFSLSQFISVACVLVGIALVVLIKKQKSINT